MTSRTPGRVTGRAPWLLGGMVVILLSLSACRQGLGQGEARVTSHAGATVLAGEEGEALAAVRGSRLLHRGARVKVTAGSAGIELPGKADLELRPGSEVHLAADVDLEAGQLLVMTPEPLFLGAAGSRIQVNGAARLSRDLAVSAASYRGDLVVESAGRSLRVPFLRQASVPSLGVMPAEPQPLRYRLDDGWDRRFLGRAMDLGEELQSRSHGLTAALPPGEGRTPGFYRVLLPGLEREPLFDAPLLSEQRPPGETLVGALITLNGRQGSFASRWSSVFSFRQQGAAWGLVAMDQGVAENDDLVRSLDRAIDQAPLAFTNPGPSPPATQAAAGTAPQQTRGRSTTGGSSGAASTPSASSGASPPSQGGLPRPPSTPADPLVAPLVDVIDGLIP